MVFPTFFNVSLNLAIRSSWSEPQSAPSLVFASQGYGFSNSHVWMWDLDYKESWVLMSWCFRTVVLEKTLESPLDCRERSKQSILKEISSEYSLEGLMLKLKLQYFGHLMRWADSFEKTLMLGKIEGRRRRGWQKEMVGWHYQFNGHEFVWTLGVGWWTGMPGVLRFMGSQRVRHNWVNWTEQI